MFTRIAILGLIIAYMNMTVPLNESQQLTILTLSAIAVGIDALIAIIK